MQLLRYPLNEHMYQIHGSLAVVRQFQIENWFSSSVFNTLSSKLEIGMQYEKILSRQMFSYRCNQRIFPSNTFNRQRNRSNNTVILDNGKVALIQNSDRSMTLVGIVICLLFS